tara:strand:- start:52 stop:315 length:264 start_codon:yes stop_codon:yes gene_type:complete
MSKGKYDRLVQDLENASKVFDKEMNKKKDYKTFAEDIQNLLEKFEISDGTRRQIFSQLMEYAGTQAAAKRANSILYDKKSPSSESGE